MSFAADIIRQESNLCTGIFTLETGISCSHELKVISKSGCELTANNLHALWQLEQSSKSVRGVNYFDTILHIYLFLLTLLGYGIYFWETIEIYSSAHSYAPRSKTR